MAEIKEEVTINAPREHVFAVISDFERYPEFLPETVSVAILERNGDTLRAEFELEMLMRISYTVEMTLNAPESMRWTLLEGRMLQKNTGSWVLAAIDERTTKATYTLDVELTRAIPAGVSERLAGSSLPQTVRRFKDRAEALLEP